MFEPAVSPRCSATARGENHAYRLQSHHHDLTFALATNVSPWTRKIMLIRLYHRIPIYSVYPRHRR